MIHIRINGGTYTAVERWDEMKLAQGIHLAQVVHDSLPKKLREYYAIISKFTGKASDEDLKKDLFLAEESWTEEDKMKLFPAFYGKVMELTTTVPQSVIDHCDPMQRVLFYNEYLKPFVYGIIHTPYNFTKTGDPYVEIDSVKYFFPEDKNVLGVQKPMGNGTTAVEFAEAADLLQFSAELGKGRIERLANVFTILCRPMDGNKIEEYDEDICLKRAEQFKDKLNMQQAWDVFFCLTEQLHLLEQNTAICLMEQAK